MNKQQQENAELLLFKQKLESTPGMKEYFESLKDEAKPDVEELVKTAIEPQLKKAQMDGIMIGWQAFALRAIKNIEDMHSIKEVKAYFKEEAKKMENKLKISLNQADDNV